MPYIKKEARKLVDKDINSLIQLVSNYEPDKKNGMANYVIYKFICGCYPPSDYDSVSDGIKTFECAKVEYIHRKLSPYEDSKRDENGDVL